jgi:hypothetical protein
MAITRRQIEIDFEIHQLIERNRNGFDDSPNDVLRKLLGLSSIPKPPDRPKLDPLKIEYDSWIDGEVRLPHGTLLRMTHNKQSYEGEIADGRWYVEGQFFDSPSGATNAFARTRKGEPTNVSGWKYWKVKLPEADDWESLKKMRRGRFRAPVR